MMSTSNLTFLGNSFHNWILAGLVFFVTLLATLLMRELLRRYVAQHPGIAKIATLDLIAGSIAHVSLWFLLSLSLYHAAQYVTLPHMPGRVIQFVLLSAILIQVLISASQLLELLLPKLLFAGQQSEYDSAIKNIILIIKIALWVVGFLFLFDNLGFNVGTMIAGLGIGGVALAFAAQKILGDAFSSFTIHFDRPFEVGDFISIDDMSGTVEHIGIKTTRVRGIGGELLVFSNSDLTDSRIRNFKKMAERRVQFEFAVARETPNDKLTRIPGFLKQIVETSGAKFDRAHFSKVTDFSSVFEVVYFVSDPDYNHYMNIQQSINLQIREMLVNERISMPCPIQMVQLKQDEDTSQR